MKYHVLTLQKRRDGWELNRLMELDPDNGPGDIEKINLSDHAELLGEIDYYEPDNGVVVATVDKCYMHEPTIIISDRVGRDALNGEIELWHFADEPTDPAPDDEGRPTVFSSYGLTTKEPPNARSHGHYFGEETIQCDGFALKVHYNV